MVYYFAPPQACMKSSLQALRSSMVEKPCQPCLSQCIPDLFDHGIPILNNTYMHPANLCSKVQPYENNSPTLLQCCLHPHPNHKGECHQDSPVQG